MGMGTFKKALKYRKSSLEIEEKERFLNKELVKTGMLSELMTTGKMYTVVKTTLGTSPTPAVQSPVPDTSGLLDPSTFTQPTQGGDEDDPDTWATGWSNIDYMFNSNTLDGVANRPICKMPWFSSDPESSHYGTGGLLYRRGLWRDIWSTLDANNVRSSMGSSTDDWDTVIEPYINSLIGKPGFLYPWQPGSDPQWATVDYWEPYSPWNPLTDFDFDDYTGVKKTVPYAMVLLSSKVYVGTAAGREEYESTPAIPGRAPFTTLISRFSLDDPSYYPGNPTKYMASLLGVSEIGADYLREKGKKRKEKEEEEPEYPRQPRDSTKPPGYYSPHPDGTTYDEYMATGRLRSDTQRTVAPKETTKGAVDAVLDALARAGGFMGKDKSAAKDTFDYYMRNVSQGTEGGEHDISNLMSPSTIRAIEDWYQKNKNDIDQISGGKTKALRNIHQQSVNYDFNELSSKDSNLKAITGNLDIGRGDGVVDKGDHIEIHKNYDFNGERDLAGGDWVGNLGSATYAKSQGIMKHMGADGKGTTPNMKMVIRINKDNGKVEAGPSEKAPPSEEKRAAWIQKEREAAEKEAAEKESAQEIEYPRQPRDPTKPAGYYNPHPDGTTYDEYMATGRLRSDTSPRDSSSPQQIADASRIREIEQQRSDLIDRMQDANEMDSKEDFEQLFKQFLDLRIEKEKLEKDAGIIKHPLKLRDLEQIFPDPGHPIDTKSTSPTMNYMPPLQTQKKGGDTKIASERGDDKRLLKDLKSGEIGPLTNPSIQKGIRDLEIKLYGMPVTPLAKGEVPTNPMGVTTKKKKKKKNLQPVVAHYELKGYVLSEGKKNKPWFLELADKKKWFNAKDIQPEYPKEPPPKLVKNVHPKMVTKVPADPHIKVTEKDLLRNHHLKDDERKELMDDINNINQLLDMQPELLPYVRIRYPADDLRLAQLNWKMDQMLEASEEYVDTQFPENKKVFKRIKLITKKNIEATNPKRFEKVKEPPTYQYMQRYDVSKLKETVTRHFKKPVRLKSWHRGHLTKP